MMNACEADSVPPRRASESDDPICDPHVAAAKHGAMQMTVMTEVNGDSQQPASVNEFDFTSDDQSTTGTTDAASIGVASLSKPCPPDCGGASLSTTYKNTRYDSSTPSLAERPRPPSLTALLLASYACRVNLELLWRKSQPRAPPAIFS